MNYRKSVLTILVIIGMITGIAVADYQATGQAGEYGVVMTINNNPPAVGHNMVTIAVKDENGKAVTDAHVRLEFGMAAMPGKPAIDYENTAAPIYDLYKAPMTLAVAGPWYVRVKIVRGNIIETATFDIYAR
ncbi:MAG: hypothetical protein A2X81_17820 [Desulfobacterales bacterium GWB2_56_26]|nr:MAG: hypothetical protein A2X81_17820 [Desulfobacterales bacterium GWB2_56_26]